MKTIFKKPVYKILDYIISSYYFKELFIRRFGYLFTCPLTRNIKYFENPYLDKKSLRSNKTAIKKAPIFITARFRSGSTFLWQIFRTIENITAYYEPLNENKWFIENNHLIDPSHIGATDYSLEYKGLHKLNELFLDKWSTQDIYMDNTYHDLHLYKYIKSLIDSSCGRPVLQFNRVDFRLDWLRVNFPNAVLIHLYRNPRDQWISVQRDGGIIPLDFKFSSNDTSINPYYLLNWAKDLQRKFPFLTPEGQHPYVIFYYIWRLSYIFGQSYADIQLSYEKLTLDFEEEIDRILNILEIDTDTSTRKKLICLNKSSGESKWLSYAPEEWFDKIERECDFNIKSFLGY